MVEVIVDQCLFGLADRLFDGVKLLAEIEAGPSLFDHRNHAPQVTLGALQPLEDLRVGLVNGFGMHAVSCPLDRILEALRAPLSQPLSRSFACSLKTTASGKL